MASPDKEVAIRAIIDELAPRARPKESLGGTPSVAEACIGIAARRGYEAAMRHVQEEQAERQREEGDNDE